jgi:hypothetical protein
MRIDILNPEGKQIENAAVGMRFNGETIPAPVLYEIGFRVTPQTLSDRVLVQLPAGAYEVWPVSKQAWAVSNASRPPIGSVKRIDLSAGPVNVQLVTSQ